MTFAASSYCGQQPTAYSIPVDTPVYVSPEFFGINSQDWPVRGVTSGGNGDHAPDFPFGSLATHDCSPLHWGSIHTADGVFNWAALDVAVAEMQSRGGDVVYSLYGTPTWLAQSGQGAQAGPYGGLGSGSYPTDLSKLASFCTALMARYNSGGVRKIKVVQLWNEPESSGGFNLTASSAKFWWGSAVQFVDTLATAYSALKAADPGVVCLSAGTYELSVFQTWATALGPVTGKYGRECFDAIALHPYHASPNSTYSTFGTLESLFLGGTKKVYQTLTACGINTSIDKYVTEWGIDSSSYAGSAITQEYTARPPEYRALYTARLLVAAALLGFKRFCFFSYGNLFGNCSGDLADDTSGVVAGLQSAYNGMAGKTIVSAQCSPSGAYLLTFSDASTYSV